MRKAITTVAERGARLARAQMPKETGRLASSITVEQSTVTVGGSKRVCASIVASADYSAAVEFGNARNSRGAHVMGAVASSMAPGGRLI